MSAGAVDLEIQVSTCEQARVVGIPIVQRFYLRNNIPVLERYTTNRGNRHGLRVLQDIQLAVRQQGPSYPHSRYSLLFCIGVTLVGLDNAGKTTILCKIITDSVL